MMVSYLVTYAAIALVSYITIISPTLPSFTHVHYGTERREVE